MPNNEQNFDWCAVVARCLAYLCLQKSEYADTPLAEKADFLKRLGLPAGDIAELLGSSRESLRVLTRLAKKKGAKKNGKVKHG